jgi:uncharacterized membrane protein YidH (DUF202 family)
VNDEIQSTAQNPQPQTPQPLTLEPHPTDAHPMESLTFDNLDQMLRKAFWTTVALGLAGATAVLIGSGWKNALLLVVGAGISAASILEWQRLVRIINARLERKKTPASTPIVVAFFVLRLTVYAGVLYGSLKCLGGSVAPLLSGLALAILTIGWQVLKLLRD